MPTFRFTYKHAYHNMLYSIIRVYIIGKVIVLYRLCIYNVYCTNILYEKYKKNHDDFFNICVCYPTLASISNISSIWLIVKKS